MVLHFWYQLTRVVPDKGPLNGCSNNETHLPIYHPFTFVLTAVFQETWVSQFPLGFLPSLVPEKNLWG